MSADQHFYCPKLSPQLSDPTISVNGRDALTRDGTLEQRSRVCTRHKNSAIQEQMQIMVDEKQASGAHKFLNFLERSRNSLRLLDRDRAYLIAEVDQASANQLSWPDRDADESDMFLFMLQAQWISNGYHDRHPDSNFAKKELWRIRENLGINSQGKLKEYAKERSMDYNRLRDMVQVTQKAGAIEAELEIPGLSTTLYSAYKRLRDLKESEIELFCRLFRASDTFLVYKSYAPTGLTLWNDFQALRQRQDLDQWIVE